MAFVFINVDKFAKHLRRACIRILFVCTIFCQDLLVLIQFVTLAL